MHTRARWLKIQCGFTLIELLITVSVLGVLLAIAIPNLRDFIVSNRLSSNVNGFIGMLSYARSEAIVRNKQVIVCPKNNTTNACVNTPDWGLYEIQIFVDEDGNNAFNSGDTLLKTFAAVDTSNTQFAFQRQGSGTNSIKFQSGGFGTNTYRFNINAINASDTGYELKYGRTICISRPGRARVQGLVNTCPA